MTMLFADTLRTNRAQQIINALDAAVTAATLAVYSGGQPDKGRDVSAMAAWAGSTAYTAGDYKTAAGHYYRAENSGTSAASAPTWPTNGSTIADNDITWQDMGLIPVLLGTLTFSKPCGTVTDGLLTFAAITDDDEANASGTATWARALDGDGTFVIDGACGALGSGAFVELNTVDIVAGGPLRATSAAILEAA
ncbi:hypothetical protein [Marinobacterium rhizophilum]|uniref:Bacteriophage lambda head decoration protein D n=1 Tax=Marinobacterium rhizophilum TaxID=420402 RepID=A0ABY5HKK6_9GAMM|nr:hypothetical protein [Marinobacterium rhizophilum]UTW12927.1 hypothetical protein KDW95_04435 [Marinobacterium rhizophilum]